MDEHPILPVLRVASLVAALLATALQAGLYYAFAVSVMPGLRQAGGRTFIDAMQQINVAILNPWFFLTFLGAPLLTVAAALLHLSGTTRAVLPWIAAAVVLCVVGVLVTGAVNVPLNEALAAAGPPDRIARSGTGTRPLRGVLGALERRARAPLRLRAGLPGLGARDLRTRPCDGVTAPAT
jgi:uncharacterized membrane protein